jgi:GNAT superfamily N-acetyltransferase
VTVANVRADEYTISCDRARLDVAAIHAYLADVYILEPHRGQGLSKRLMEYVLAHPDLQGLRRFMLATRDAHRLYRRFGFAPLNDSSRIMERLRASPYLCA